MEYVSYLRVSTKSQGESRLGLESQESIVKKFIKEPDVIVKQYIEVESGKNNNRPMLLEALNYCKEHKATLLLATLSRLSRDAKFILTIQESDIEFVCVDMPQANKFTISLFGLISQYEREQISERTKNSLQALKARGVKLGTPANLTQAARDRSVEVRKENAKNNPNTIRARKLVKTLLEKDFFMSLKSIADELNTNGFKTARGKAYFPSSVKRIVDSLKE